MNKNKKVVNLLVETNKGGMEIKEAHMTITDTLFITNYLLETLYKSSNVEFNEIVESFKIKEEK